MAQFSSTNLLENDPTDLTFLSRSSHDVSSVDGIVYSFGGENIARTPIDSELYYLETSSETMSWQKVSIVSGTPPQARIAQAQAVIGSRIWIFGGKYHEYEYFGCFC